MKHPIRDASQIILALLITTSMVVCNAATPSPTQSVHVKVQTQSDVNIVEPKPTPAPTQDTPVAVVAPETASSASTPQTPVQAPVASSQPTYSGGHEDLMSAAGIDSSDYSAVDYIVSHESGWNPDATNASSGAHGLPQALPYSKTGCGWSDAICQLEWASQYATQRYGSWAGAEAFWIANHYW